MYLFKLSWRFLWDFRPMLFSVISFKKVELGSELTNFSSMPFFFGGGGFGLFKASSGRKL